MGIWAHRVCGPVGTHPSGDGPFAIPIPANPLHFSHPKPKIRISLKKKTKNAMFSLLSRALCAASSSPAAPRGRSLLAALLSPSASPLDPCRGPAAPEPPRRRAFHGSPSPLGFRSTPASWSSPEAGAAVGGDDGLEVARLGISPWIVERLAARGITRLFPIQVAGLLLANWKLIMACLIWSGFGMKE